MFDLGRPVPFHEARDPVSLPVQRRWCDTMGLENGVYIDEAVAQRSAFGRITSPLAMLDIWTKPGLAYRRNAGDPVGAAYETLEADGFTSAVAVATELEQLRPIVLGDDLRSTVTLESVSESKLTRLGLARFMTSQQAFFVGDERLGHNRFTVMKFRPHGVHRDFTALTSAPPAEPVAAAPQRDELGTVRASTIRAGEALPNVPILVTPTLIVAGALMTSDYYEAHHDRDAAVRLGSRDIFMNIHTTLGLLQRCIGDWLGPNARWHTMRAQLGAPNYPYDKMVVGSTIAAINDRTGRTTIDFRATNGLGPHATGTAAVTLPL